MNVYDVRLVDDYPACGMNWPPDLSDVYTFLRVSGLSDQSSKHTCLMTWIAADCRSDRT